MSALIRAIDGLREMITSGEIKPNDQFPNETELCHRLGVSRSSLREAVQALSALGVVDSKQGSGRYVSDLTSTTVINGFKLTIDLVPLKGLLEFMEIRKILEAHAAALASMKMQEKNHEHLLSLLKQMREAKSLPEFQDLDNDFHATICSFAENDALSAFSAVFRATGRPYQFSGEGLDELFAASDQQHRLIVEAIVNHDPVAAAGAASAHVHGTMTLLEKYYAS